MKNKTSMVNNEKEKDWVVETFAGDTFFQICVCLRSTTHKLFFNHKKMSMIWNFFRNYMNTCVGFVVSSACLLSLMIPVLTPISRRFWIPFVGLVGFCVCGVNAIQNTSLDLFVNHVCLHGFLLVCLKKLHAICNIIQNTTKKIIWVLQLLVLIE